MTTDDVQYLDWQWVEENPQWALDLMLELHRENAALRDAIEAMPTCRCEMSTDDQCALAAENAALRKLVEHWYKLVPDNIRSAIKDAQEEGQL